MQLFSRAGVVSLMRKFLIDITCLQLLVSLQALPFGILTLSMSKRLLLPLFQNLWILTQTMESLFDNWNSNPPCP